MAENPKSPCPFTAGRVGHWRYCRIHSQSLKGDLTHMHNSSLPPRFWLLRGLLLALCIIGPAYPATKQHWIGSWYASPTKYVVSFDNATVRTVVHLTAG